MNTQGTGAQKVARQRGKRAASPEEARDGMRPFVKRVHVIINPASGADRPILNILNTVFQETDMEWTASVTHKADDAYRQAQQARSQGVDVVAAYGGDGTIREVAGALAGGEIPMAILPGGTANAAALALNIPGDLTQAARLIGAPDSIVEPLDLGKIDGQHFLVAIGVGMPGELAEKADRDDKDRLGVLAYLIHSIEATRDTEIAQYQITLDGEEVHTEGVACLIANAGTFGVGGLSLSKKIDMTDGLLDLMIVRKADVQTIVSLAAKVVNQDGDSEPFQHWQAREIRLMADPPQPIQIDGEIYEEHQVNASILHHAIRIIVPSSSGS